MNRRELLKLGTATLAMSTLTRESDAQGAAAQMTSNFALSAYSRNLQWLRTPKELAQGVIDLGLSRVDLTVLPSSGHVDPARAGSDLPSFVEGLKQGGVSVTCITTDIGPDDLVKAEGVIKAASGAGITHYVWSGLRYDETKPYQPQIDALKSQLQGLARLNQRYNIKGLYHPERSAGSVGATFFDILEPLRNFDPKYSGIHYDTANLLQATPETMAAHLRTGADYIGGIAITDAAVALQLPDWQSGPYTGGPYDVANLYTGGDYTGGQYEGNPMALGGGGRPLPYRYNPVRVGTGMLDLTLLSKTLKEINFSGPAETQARYPLAGAENGSTTITAERLYVLGMLKRDRITVEQAFAPVWHLEIELPEFLRIRQGLPVTTRRRSGRGAPPGGPPPGGMPN